MPFTFFHALVPRCALRNPEHRAHRKATECMYLLHTAARRRKITETMRSLSLSALSVSQAAAATTTTASTSVRMPASILPRAAFKPLDFHRSRSAALFRHHPWAWSSHRAVSAASTDAEAMASSSASASEAAGGIDIVGQQLPEKGEEQEEKLPTSFDAFDLDERVTVRSSEMRKKERESASERRYYFFHRRRRSSRCSRSRPHK